MKNNTIYCILKSKKVPFGEGVIKAKAKRLKIERLAPQFLRSEEKEV